MNRKFFLAFAATILGISSALAQDEIKVGEFASLTGGSASFGQSSHKGTALAIEEINAAGGVLGKKIKLHHRGRPVARPASRRRSCAS